MDMDMVKHSETHFTPILSFAKQWVLSDYISGGQLAPSC